MLMLAVWWTRWTLKVRARAACIVSRGGNSSRASREQSDVAHIYSQTTVSQSDLHTVHTQNTAEAKHQTPRQSWAAELSIKSENMLLKTL